MSEGFLEQFDEHDVRLAGLPAGKAEMGAGYPTKPALTEEDPFDPSRYWSIFSGTD
jgi:hypothetical protein